MPLCHWVDLRHTDYGECNVTHKSLVPEKLAPSQSQGNVTEHR